MAMSSDQQRDLRTLMTSLCDGSISPGEFERLQQWIEEDDDALAEYVDYADLHAFLAWEVSSRDLVRASHAPASGWRHHLSAAWNYYRQPLHLSLSIAGIVMAAIILGMGLMFPAVQSPTGSEMRPAARLTELHNVIWAKHTDRFKRFSELASGQRLALERGVVEISYSEGTRVTFEGPGVFVVDGHGSGVVEQGKAVSFVPPKAIGFTIRTPVASIVDLGTEFGVEVAPSGESDVLVYSGKVSFTPRSEGGRAGILTAGKSIRISTAGVPVELPSRPTFVQDIRQVGEGFDGTAEILIDFGDGELNGNREASISQRSPTPTLGGFWNVLDDPSPAAPLALLDAGGNQTGAFVLPFRFEEITRNTKNPGDDVEWVDRDSRIDFFATPVGQRRNIVLTGFDPDLRYRVELVGARDDGDVNRLADYRVQGKFADSSPNGQAFHAVRDGWSSQAVLRWDSVAPLRSGNIVITVEAYVDSYGYVNALRIQKVPDP